MPWRLGISRRASGRGRDAYAGIRKGSLEETGIVVIPKSLIGVYSNTKKPSILMLDFVCEYISGDPKTSAESLLVEWVAKDEVLLRVKHPSIHGRLKTMLEFSGEVTYRAYFVDPNQIDLDYKELEDRRI